KQAFEEMFTGTAAVFDCTFRIRSSGGEFVWILSRGVPVFNDKAQVYKVIGSIEDVSRSRRYNRIRERLNFMQHIADALPIPVYYKDMQGRYIGFNEAFKEFGRLFAKVTPMIGYTVRDLHKLTDREVGIQLENDEKKFLENPTKNFEKTYCLSQVSGKKHFVVNKKSILYDEESNKPRYLVGGIFDITTIKETEARLQQATERLNATLDAMSENIMCFDRQLTLLWANRAARIALEGENKRFTGRKWNKIWAAAENLDPQEYPVYKILNENLDFSTGKMKTGNGRIFEVRAYPLRSRGRRINGVLEMSMDITEHEAVKKRAEIHKEQLMLADKMKSLGVLISGVAHEINNPNNSININIALLQKMWQELKPVFYRELKKSPNFKLGNIPGSKLETSMDDLLFGIKDGSERIGRIIDSLKAYIRNVPDDGRKLFDVHDAIDNAVFLLKNQIAKATCRFNIRRCSGKLPVSGDQQKIEQVIINVLQNSCQALTSRKQSISIETSGSVPGKAVIRISDTGSGIEKENLNYITDPFFTTKRESGGTGLGLSISSSILDEHKAYFNFSSVPGKGTTVEIVLPAADESESDGIVSKPGGEL
ncbi:MAG: ATP-binding protein, partial [Victivallales bacterium]|nr:ATP-binding protein [Victivallales bacterium]